MFFRKKPELECTNDGYVRWLRAQRPPFEWFFARSEIEQETLATHGDEQWAAVAAAIAEELRGGESTPAASDADVAREAARAVLDHIQAGRQPQAPSPMPPNAPTFGGIGREIDKTPDNGQPDRSFLGKPADPLETIT